MISKSKLHLSGLVLALGAICTFLVVACSDDDSPTTPDEPSTIEGRVTDDGGFNALAKSTGVVEGAAVTLARVQADGSLNTVSNDTVQSDASGRFVIETDVHGERGLVAVATKETDEWRAVVTAEVRNGTRVNCQPMNDETTLEADVYAGIVADGQSDRVAYTNIASNIDIDVATMLNGDAAAVGELTTAFAAEAEAHNETLTDASIGGSQSQLDAVIIARTQAQASLEAALFAAGEDQSAIDAAFDAFHEADINAYVESGFSVQSYAKAKEVSVQAFMKNAANLSSQAQFALNQSAAKQKASVTVVAVQESFIALGATETQMTGVLQAGLDLQTSVDGASTTAQISAAFQSYHDTIVNELQNVASAHAAGIASVDVTLNATGGAKQILDIAVLAAVTPDALVDAYVAFFGGAKTLVETTLSTASSAEVEAIADALILVNMQV